jgi:hypothetical protein
MPSSHLGRFWGVSVAATRIQIRGAGGYVDAGAVQIFSLEGLILYRMHPNDRCLDTNIWKSKIYKPHNVDHK